LLSDRSAKQRASDQSETITRTSPVHVNGRGTINAYLGCILKYPQSRPFRRISGRHCNGLLVTYGIEVHQRCATDSITSRLRPRQTLSGTGNLASCGHGATVVATNPLKHCHIIADKRLILTMM